MYSQRQKGSFRQPSVLEKQVIETIIGKGFGLYEKYANDVPMSIKQKCDFEMKTQGSVRVAYSKESISNLELGGQDIARSINGILHYHETSFGGVTHWTPNTYFKAVKASDIADENLRRVRTFAYDIDQKMSVQQVLFAFEMSGIPCKPSLILETPRGVQFFIVLKESDAWYGSKKAIDFGKAIGEAARELLSDVGLPIDLNNSIFGWSRFPREESILYFEPSNGWSKNESVEWFNSLDISRGKAYINGSWLTSQAGKALWETHEKGSRDEVVFELSVMARLDGLDVEEALSMLLERNTKVEAPLGKRQLEKTVKSAFKKDYQVSINKVERLCGVRPKLKGFYKHKKAKEERLYEKTEELVKRLESHFEKVLPVGEGGSMSLSANQLAKEINQESKQVKSLTRAFKHVSKSRFIIQKKRDPRGNILKGRASGFRIFRTETYLQLIKEAKKALKTAPTSISYQVLSRRTHEKTYSNLMCQLPLHLGTVSPGLFSGEQYRALAMLWWFEDS